MDITLIPGIMRRREWLNGARLQDIWFSRPSNSVPERGAPDTTTIKMDSWALKFLRCAQAYRTMTEGRYWCGDEARRNLGRILQRQGKLTSLGTTFGNLSLSVPQLDADQVLTEIWAGSLNDPLDDMYAALGSFAIRVVAAGTVAPLRSPFPFQSPLPSMSGARPPTKVIRHQAHIEQVGFFIRDSFDFNELIQPLGFWNRTNVVRTPTRGYELIGNNTYRAWRAAHGRGGDFIVYSDLKVVRRSPPDTVEIPVEFSIT
jgi:hypothetical protein